MLLDAAKSFGTLKQFDNAILVLDWTSKHFVSSANTLDSLADAYMPAGKTKLALKATNKALALDPKLTESINRLKQLSE